MKAVFFDRDGVINNDTGHYYIYKAENFSLNIDIIKSMQLLQKHDFRIIIISNQGGISKGIYSKADVEKVHKLMLNQFAQHSISIDEIYYCPHHNDIENCLCRKPNSLMIEKAIARFKINRDKSFLIGDSNRDIEAGEKANLKSYKIEKNTSVYNICQEIISNE